jgi:hypothetical protein
MQEEEEGWEKRKKAMTRRRHGFLPFLPNLPLLPA